MASSQALPDPVIRDLLQRISELDQERYDQLMRAARRVNPSRQKSSNLSEKALIERILTGGPDQAFKDRFRDLSFRNKSNEGLTFSETEELQYQIEVLGKWSIERTKLLLQLAKLRNQNLVALTKELKLEELAQLYA